MSKRSIFQKILWGITILTMIILLLGHTYNDILITTRQGMNLWNILFHGDFLRFFSQSHVRSGNVYYSIDQGAAYNILIYIVFAVWNIPLVLLEHFTSLDVMNSMPCLVYMKMLPVVALLLTGFLLKKIFGIFELKEKNKSFLLYLYMSSSLVLSVIFIIAQYDILGMIWQLAGFYYFLKKDYKRFVIFFAIAFCFKYFAIIIFLPLLFLHCKKILNLLLTMVLFFLPMFISNVVFLPYSSGGSGGSLVTNSLLTQAFSFNIGTINPFVIIYVLVLVWCYLKNPDEDVKIVRRQAVWACFVSYASFFCLLDVLPYWSIILAPFIVLLFACMSDHFRTGLLIETVGLICMMFANMLRYHWCYFGDTMKSMLYSAIGRRDLEDSFIYSMIIRLGAYPIMIPVFRSAFAAACCALAFLSYTNLRKEYSGEENSIDGVKDVMCLRTVLTTGICVLPIMSLFI